VGWLRVLLRFSSLDSSSKNLNIILLYDGVSFGRRLYP